RSTLSPYTTPFRSTRSFSARQPAARTWSSVGGQGKTAEKRLCVDYPLDTMRVRKRDGDATRVRIRRHGRPLAFEENGHDSRHQSAQGRSGYPVRSTPTTGTAPRLRKPHQRLRLAPLHARARVRRLG